jgi:hypothetical protein
VRELPDDSKLETALPLLFDAVGLAGEELVLSSRDMAMALLISSSSLSVDESDMMATFNAAQVVGVSAAFIRETRFERDILPKSDSNR